MNTMVTVTLNPAAFFASSAGNWTLAAAPPVLGGGERPAQSTTGAQPLGPAGQQGSAASPPGSSMLLFMILPVFVLMILLSSMGSRKEKKRRAELLSSLGRHDRVQTAGGLIGTIVELKDDEIILKIDESTNTRAHFARSAVQAVLKKRGGNGSDALAPAETATS